MLLVTAAWKPASVLVQSDPQIRISFYATRIACMNMNMQGKAAGMGQLGNKQGFWKLKRRAGPLHSQVSCPPQFHATSTSTFRSLGLVLSLESAT